MSTNLLPEFTMAESDRLLQLDQFGQLDESDESDESNQESSSQYLGKLCGIHCKVTIC